VSKILVTGGTGLIGTNLVRTLCERGEKVRVLVRKSSNQEGFEGLDNLEIVYGDVRNYEDMRTAVDSIEQVYHLAAKVVLSPFRREEHFAINVEGVKNLCKAAKDAKVKRVVHTSTVSTIGGGTKEKPADESTFYNCYKLDCPYWTSKYLAELVVMDAVCNNNLDAVIVNPSFVVGPWDIRPNSGAIILWSATIGGLISYPKHGTMNVIDVRDVVEAEIAAMDKGKTGQRYILGNYNVSHKEFITLIAETLNLRKPFFPIPMKLAYPLVWPGDMLGSATNWTFFDKWNSLMLKITEVQQYVDSSKAKRELNLPCTDLKKSILDTYNWFKEHGRL
jgi:dihydroflavonol-4-reductase